MKKQITWLDDILKKYKFFFILFLFLSLPNLTYASDRWILDKELSTIEFELPVLFAKNVKGSFNTMEGFIEIDVSQKENNKAIFYVEVKDLDMNYTRYKDLLLSNIFFDSKQFPKAVVDTPNTICMGNTSSTIFLPGENGGRPNITVNVNGTATTLEDYINGLIEAAFVARGL